jgi:hypothetical protein
VCYEEGFVIEVEADSAAQADQIAYDKVDYWGNSAADKCVHRDFWVDTVEEQVNA